MAINFVGDNDHGDKVLPLSDLLWEEVTKLRQEVVRLNNVITELKEGFEGCCNACEPVGLMNKKLREERDEARLNLCDMYTRTQPTGCQMKAEDYAHDNDWDCFKTLDQRNKSIDNIHKSIMNNHKDLFQKLAQEEKTNG
jgi:hypothetical protein